MKRPFEGFRVVACSQYIASSLACQFMSSLGADVIKIEGPTRPDPGRLNAANPGSTGGYPKNDPGREWWNRNSFFHAVNSGQRSLTLDVKTSEGRDVFRQLVVEADVVVDSFRPGVMEAWGLDYSALRAINEGLVVACVSGYGHVGGPYSGYPGTGTVMEATHGHAFLTGEAGGPPTKAGLAFVDFIGTWSLVMAVAAALRRRLTTGRGDWIDMSLYELGVYFLPEYLLDWQVNGRIGSRVGNRHRWQLQGCYRAAGTDQWVTIAIGSDDEWAHLCTAMGRPDLIDDPRFATTPGRLRHHDELDEAIEAWTCGQDKNDIFHALQTRSLRCGPVLDARDLHLDRHLQSIGYLEARTVDLGDGAAELPFIASPWRFSGFDTACAVGAPRLGEHSREILSGLGLTPEEVDVLDREAITGADLSRAPSPRFVGSDEMVAQGRITGYDPRYADIVAAVLGLGSDGD